MFSSELQYNKDLYNYHVNSLVINLIQTNYGDVHENSWDQRLRIWTCHCMYHRKWWNVTFRRIGTLADRCNCDVAMKVIETTLTCGTSQRHSKNSNSFALPSFPKSCEVSRIYKVPKLHPEANLRPTLTQCPSVPPCSSYRVYHAFDTLVCLNSVQVVLNRLCVLILGETCKNK